MTNIILTDLETKLVENTVTNDYGDGVPGAAIWNDSWDCGKHGAFVTGNTISGVFSSLVKKGVITTNGAPGRDGTFKLTPLGIVVAAAIFGVAEELGITVEGGAA